LRNLRHAWSGANSISFQATLEGDQIDLIATSRSLARRLQQKVRAELLVGGEGNLGTAHRAGDTRRLRRGPTSARGGRLGAANRLAASNPHGADEILFERFRHSFTNSGVMVIEPSAQLFERMLEALSRAPTYDGV
jgi:hypothetical protein